MTMNAVSAGQCARYQIGGGQTASSHAIRATGGTRTAPSNRPTWGFSVRRSR